MTKILVTGGLGFIGSNFILSTLKNNSKITITNIDMEKNEQFMYLIGGLCLAVGISYGVNYLFTKFKKDK